MSANSREIVQRYFDEVLNGYHTGLADELFTGDFLFHFPGSPEPLARAGWQATSDQFRSAFPDQHTTVDALIAADGDVAARFTFRGSQTGDFMGMPASGRSATMTGMAMFRLEGDRIAEHWVEFDALGLMQQLGAMPAPA
jgi:steroid delta-isomerase-like uncharacterized protein